MPKYRRVRFKILGFTPDTLPMGRLAEYLADFALLLGHDHAVHFRRVEDGSAELVSDIDEPELPNIRKRALDAAEGFGPQEAVLGYRAINAKLREDKTSGEMQGDRGAKILQFPGVVAEPAGTFGPFNQQGAVDGVLIKIGGRGQTIPVHLEEEGRIWICNATREMAKKLAPNLFGDPIRLHGTGRWTRESSGEWTLIGFNIADFDVLNNDPLPVVIGRLRAIPNNEWATVDDPLGELVRIRKGEGNTQ
jgi:hypothetical protein